jgi:cysteine synthase A
VLIGQTPLIRLERMAPPNGVEIWVKWEGANPTGSMKDRMALSMILGAERRGQLRRGGRVVDYTGGSTGSSLAMVCAARGYKAHFVSSSTIPTTAPGITRWPRRRSPRLAAGWTNT